MTVPDQIARFLHRHGLADRPGVVAVSGGPDSVALLRGLRLVQPSAVSVTVAHLHHQLRGADSDADEQFVRDLVEEMQSRGEGIALRCHRLDVRALADAQRENLESAARQARYQWLASVAQEVGATWVAAGHTADDQAETVLHRLLRGAGLRGLAGIPDRRPLTPDIALIRPLLKVRRGDVVAFLDGLGQTYRLDASNADVRFTRNRIRHELLPLLTDQFNPAVVKVLGRLAEQATDVHQREEEAARQLLGIAELPRAGALIVLRAEPLQAASRHLVREMLHLVWQRENWPLGAMTFEAWDRAAAVALGETPEVELPGNTVARRRGAVVQLALVGKRTGGVSTRV